MALDNLNKFSAFTNFNPNIAEYGMTPEEFTIQQGKPDANPMVSPMAKPAVAEAKLSLGNQGSDKLRLTSPSEPAVNPYAGPGRTLSHSRNAVTKLRGAVIGSLRGMTQNSNVGTPETRKLQGDSIRRLDIMVELLDYKISLGESITAHTLAAAKG